MAPMPELAIILVVILILVLISRGPKTLPKLGEALGRGVREAREAAKGPDETGADGEALPPGQERPPTGS
jgi:Sec-independent protein translocase protein TatA